LRRAVRCSFGNLSARNRPTALPNFIEVSSGSAPIAPNSERTAKSSALFCRLLLFFGTGEIVKAATENLKSKIYSNFQLNEANNAEARTK
jgi:hypothetical protein